MNVAARNVAASSAILLAESVVRLAAVAAVSFWIARQLGPAQFGILNFASALLAILLGFADMGLDTPVILRLTGTTPPGALLGTVMAVRGAVSILVFSCAALLAFGLKRGDVPAMLVMLIVSLSIFGCIPTVLDFWFKARTSAGAPSLARTAATLLSAGAKGVCLILGLGIVALAWTIVLEALLTGVGLWGAFRWSAAGSPADRLSFDRSLVAPLLTECWPYVLSNIAVLLYMKIDVVMLGYMSTNTQTGIYGLAQKLSEVLTVVPVVLVTSAYPALARRFRDGAQSGARSQQMLFDLAVGGSIAAVALSLMLVRPVIQDVFGAGYEPAINIFYLHSFSCIAVGMNYARHRWMAALSLQRYAPTVTAVGVVINVAMNCVLIPKLGALGAAIATVVSYFASGYLTSFLIKPLRESGWAQTRALWPWARLYRSARVWQHGEQLR